jgi:hypothetical protein
VVRVAVGFPGGLGGNGAGSVASYRTMVPLSVSANRPNYLFIYVLVLILVMVSRRSTRDMRPAHSSISRPTPTLVSCIFFFSPRQLYLSDLVHRLIPLLTFATTSLLRCPTLFTTCHHLGPPPPPLYFVIISSPPPLLLESGFLTTGDAPIQRDACDLSLS